MSELFVFLLLFLGGIGIDRWWVVVVGLTVEVAWLVWLMRKGELKIYRGWREELVWLGLVVLSGVVVGVDGDWGWWSLYVVSGVMLSLVASNLGKKVNWVRVGVGVGIGFSLLALANGDKLGSLSLVGWATRQHHHLADWWGVVLVGLGEVGWGWRVVGGVLGGWWLVGGLSRSAYVSLLGGVGWLGRKIGKWVLVGVVVSLLSLSLWASRGKGLVSHRVYFWEGVRGIIAKPWGWGWGDFIEASEKFKVDKWSCGSCVSSYAHNLWLEVGVRGGILVGGWLVWLWLKKLGRMKNGWEAGMLIAIMINFLVDYTYMIPAMWWLFWGLWGRMET